MTGQVLGVVLMMTSEKVRALSHGCLAVYSLGCYQLVLHRLLVFSVEASAVLCCVLAQTHRLS